MATIYVYKFKNGYLDVFEATCPAEIKSDGTLPYSRGLYKRTKDAIVEFTKCLVNSSGKGISQYSSLYSIICRPETIFRNMIWLPEYNIEKAIKIFKEDIDNKISECNKTLDELQSYKSILEDSEIFYSHSKLQ